MPRLRKAPPNARVALCAALLLCLSLQSSAQPAASLPPRPSGAALASTAQKFLPPKRGGGEDGSQADFAQGLVRLFAESYLWESAEAPPERDAAAHAAPELGNEAAPAEDSEVFSGHGAEASPKKESASAAHDAPQHGSDAASRDRDGGSSAEAPPEEPDAAASAAPQRGGGSASREGDGGRSTATLSEKEPAAAAPAAPEPSSGGLRDKVFIGRSAEAPPDEKQKKSGAAATASPKLGSDHGGSGFPFWLLFVVPLLAIATYYIRTHPTVLRIFSEQAAAVSVQAGELKHILRKKLSMEDEAQGTDDRTTSETMLLKGGQDVDVTFLGEESPSDHAAYRSSFRQKMCSLMTCVWGRDDSKKTPLPPLFQPASSASAEDVEAVIQQMRTTKADVSLQEHSLKRLEEWALEPELKRRIHDAGGPDTIIEIMHAHPNSPAVQEHACAALGNQASNSEEQQALLAEQGAVGAVIKAMFEHSSNFRVQETACWALREFALAEEGRKVISESGGIERVLGAMQAHPAAVAVLEHGCMALAYLSYDAELRRWIAYDGGINLVIHCMMSQPDDSVVQEAGCLALRNMSCSKEPQQAILELRGDEAVVQAMRAHCASAAVVETAADAMLIMGPAPRRLHEIGALELVCKAAKRHSTHEGLQVKACKLLAYAAKDEETAEQVRRLTGPELFDQMQAQFRESKEVQEAAAEVMRALAKPAAEDAGGERGDGAPSIG